MAKSVKVGWSALGYMKFVGFQYYFFHFTRPQKGLEIANTVISNLSLLMCAL